MTIELLFEKLEAEYTKRKNDQKEYSRKKFAKDIGISAPLLSLLVHKKTPLTMATAVKIAMCLKFSEDELIATIRAVMAASRIQVEAEKQAEEASAQPNLIG